MGNVFVNSIYINEVIINHTLQVFDERKSLDVICLAQGLLPKTLFSEFKAYIIPDIYINYSSESLQWYNK